MAKKVEKRVPDVRFKGFTDDWERRKGKDYLSESFIPGNTGSNSRKLTVKLWGKGVVKKQVIGNGSKNTKYYLRKPGQLIYGKLDFIHAAFGIVPKELIGYESTIDSPAFDITDGSPIFLLNLFLRREFYERFGLMANGSRRAKRIHEKDFLNMPFFAGSYNEQKKIGEIILKISNLITLQHKKLEQLRLLKKAMLQQLFPDKDGKLQVRFKGFTDAWEQRKGSEIFRSKSERGFPSLPVLSATQDEGMIYRDNSGIDIKFNKSSLINYKRIVPGDFVVHLRSFQGGFAYSNVEGIASPAYTVFSFIHSEQFNDDFWKEKFTSYNFIQLLKKVTYGVRDGRSISYTDFLTLNESFPSFNEQRKIGNLLEHLDNLISIQQSKLDNLNKFKKFLLQKMFI